MADTQRPADGLNSSVIRTSPLAVLALLALIGPFAFLTVTVLIQISIAIDDPPKDRWRQHHVPARHLHTSSDNKSMRRIVLVGAMLICGSLFVGCSRKAGTDRSAPA